MSKPNGLLSSDEAEKSKPESTGHGKLHSDGAFGVRVQDLM
jgi:hypothetical protein